MDDNKDILKDTKYSIGADYAVGNDGTLYRINRKITDGENMEITKIPFANFFVKVDGVQCIDDGIETKEEILTSVFRDYRYSSTVAVTLKDILGQMPTLKFGAACRIYIVKNATAWFRECFQIQCERAKMTTVYQKTGFDIIDGERVFLNGGYSVTQNGLTDKFNVNGIGKLAQYCFLPEREPERYNTLLSVFPSVAPKSLIYSGLALSFLTPLNAILRSEGIEPSFILYFTGKTGTRKTTMAKLLLNFFGVFNNGTVAPASFMDTTNSLGKKLAVTDSTLVLLDDRIPSTTPQIKAQMEKMEQFVARLIGDKAGRDRLKSDSSMQVTPVPKCNLIITAEDAYNNVGESAVARSLSVEIKPNSVNLTALTEVQKNARHLNQCMGDYVQWVICNWENIKERVNPLFIDLRAKAQNGGHGRLAESVAHLQIGMIFMCEWLQSVNVLSESDAADMLNQSWDVFISLAEEQNRRIVDEKPVNLFLDAIREMLDRKVIKTVDTATVATGNYDYPGIVGYHDKEYYYFYPDAVYTAVKKFYAEQERSFPLGKAALFQYLANENLIEQDINRKTGEAQNTKSKRIKGLDRTRYLWLKAEALNATETEEKEDKS